MKTQTSPGPAVGSSKKGSKPTLQGASWLTNRRCVSVHPRPTGGAPRNLWHAVGKGESKRGVSNSQLLRIAGVRAPMGAVERPKPKKSRPPHGNARAQAQGCWAERPGRREGCIQHFKHGRRNSIAREVFPLGRFSQQGVLCDVLKSAINHSFRRHRPSRRADWPARRVCRVLQRGEVSNWPDMTSSAARGNSTPGLNATGAHHTLSCSSLHGLKGDIGAWQGPAKRNFGLRTASTRCPGRGRCDADRNQQQG